MGLSALACPGRSAELPVAWTDIASLRRPQRPLGPLDRPRPRRPAPLRILGGVPQFPEASTELGVDSRAGDRNGLAQGVQWPRQPHVKVQRYRPIPQFVCSLFSPVSWQAHLSWHGAGLTRGRAAAATCRVFRHGPCEIGMLDRLTSSSPFGARRHWRTSSSGLTPFGSRDRDVGWSSAAASGR